MRRIFITGGTGFFGKSMLDYRLRHPDWEWAQAEWIILSRSPERFVAVHPQLANQPGVSFGAGTLCEGYFCFLGECAKGHVGDIDRAFEHHGLFCMCSYDCSDGHSFIVVKRRRVKLCSEKEDVLPFWQRQLSAHSSVKGFALYSHIMDLIHVSLVSFLAEEQ